jgi:tetraacyldisaccharide 4'-kinase
MPPKTPNFWQEDTLISKFLTPFSKLYDIGQKMDAVITLPYKSSIPVFCIGGIVAGGSGKTPTLHAFLKLIREHSLFQNPVIITRGYGGKITHSTRVDPSVHTYQDVGDEALLHARHAPTIVGRNRMASAKLAETMGADLILMDDGLQNKKLEKTGSILVIDGLQGLGNGKLLPAGPLRETLADGLEKVFAVIEIGQSDLFIPQKPFLKARLQITSHHDSTAPYVAFAGLGYPHKFRQTLIANNFNVQDFVAFADHHPYTENDIQKIRDQANGAKLITTAKDYIRIPVSCREGIEVLDVAVVLDTPDLAKSLIRDNLSAP